VEKYYHQRKNSPVVFLKAGITFAVLGAEEKSTGECVRRAGNEMLFQEMAGEFIESFKENNVTSVITCDPHAYNTLKNEYPEFGGHFDVIHHTQFINELLETQKIEVNETFDNVIYHDPCYLGRHNGEYDAPRNVIDRITSDDVIEFDMNRDKSMCGGAGGGRMWMEETIGERINETRVEQAVSKDPKVIATACPYCLIMMDEATGNKGLQDKIERKDIAELVAGALV
jgi:Fe-S oxidoreductase